MTSEEIIVKYEKALKEFIKKEKYLIDNNASERAMAHRLAIHLEKNFKGYDVDCEYNVNIDHDRGSKKIYLLETEAKKYKNKKEGEVQVYPDIIVHKRGVNTDNLLIIEMKKESSTVSRDFDFLKLKKYTDNSDSNSFKYDFGIFLEIGKDTKYYKDGNEFTPQVTES